VEKQSRNSLTLIIGYFLSFIILGMSTATLGPALPYLAKNVGTSLKSISLVFIGHRLGYLIGSFAGGHLYDRVSGNRLMAVVLLILGLGLVLVPITSLLFLLVAVVFFIGLGEGTVDVGGNVLLVWTQPPKVGSLMNALHLFFGIGSFIAPLVLTQAIRISGSIRWGYWILAVWIVPVAVLLFRLPSPEAHQPREEGGSTAGGLLLPGLLALFFFLHVAAESSLGGWLYTYAFTKWLADSVSAGYLASAFWGSFTFGRLVSIFLALKISARVQLGSGVAGALLSAAVLLLWPDSRAALWIGALSFGFSLAGLFPGSITLASECLHMSGRITGVFLVGSSLGSMALPWLIGQFFESVGPEVFPAFLFAAAVGTLLVFSVIVLYLSKRKQPA